MRRLLTSWAALSILGAVLGCNHTAGTCDCNDCCGGAPTGPMPILKPEPLQMPKENGGAKQAELPLDKKDKEEIKEN